MIKNEKQYQITKKKLQGIREQNMRIQKKGEQQSVTDRLILAPGLDMQQELENEISAYENAAKNLLLNQ
jgi:hypothetical protein